MGSGGGFLQGGLMGAMSWGQDALGHPLPAPRTLSPAPMTLDLISGSSAEGPQHSKEIRSRFWVIEGQSDACASLLSPAARPAESQRLRPRHSQGTWSPPWSRAQPSLQGREQDPDPDVSSFSGMEDGWKLFQACSGAVFGWLPLGPDPGMRVPCRVTSRGWR